jgi:ATP-dependent Clp protease ATP-binding subunit ClpB
LLAVAQDSDVKNAFSEAGLPYNKLETATATVRGGRKVESKSAEGTFEALTKYGRDLVADAEGKIYFL